MKPFSIRELIIEVQAQLQRQNSFKRDKLSEAAIVWRLNTAQDRFVKYRIKPDPNNPTRFMVDEKYRSDIQSLIKPNVSIRTFYDRKNQAYGYLPYDFEYLVADQSVILENCKSQFTNPRETINFTLYSLTFPESGLDTPPFYKTLAITVTGQVPFTYTTVGTTSKKEKFEFIEFLIIKLDEIGASHTSPWKTYWEKYKNYYFPDQFIIVGQVGVPSVKITSDSTLGGNDVKTYSESRFRLFDGDVKPNRGVKNDFVRDIYNNYYDNPTPDSPVTSLADNRIFVHTTERFLVPEILIDYIRKPRRISLSLNQTSELPGSTHPEICSIAVEDILGNIEANNHQSKVQENITRLE